MSWPMWAVLTAELTGALNSGGCQSCDWSRALPGILGGALVAYYSQFEVIVTLSVSAVTIGTLRRRGVLSELAGGPSRWLPRVVLVAGSVVSSAMILGFFLVNMPPSQVWPRPTTSMAIVIPIVSSYALYGMITCLGCRYLARLRLTRSGDGIEAAINRTAFRSAVGLFGAALVLPLYSMFAYLLVALLNAMLER